MSSDESAKRLMLLWMILWNLSMNRDDDSNTILSFNTGDKYVECGARPKHLRNKDVILGEMQKDGEIVFHWDRIFPSLSK